MVEFNHTPEAHGPRDAALTWFVRLNSGDATAADWDGFEAWLAADPRHRLEYEKLGALWTDLDALPDPRPARSAGRGRIMRRGLLMGAAAIGVAAAIPLSGVPTVLAADFRTDTGERKEITVSDGTRIELDAGTAIADDYTPEVRRLRLLEGRAMFSVPEDPHRPFEVICADGVTRTAAGTFVVHRRVDDVMTAVEAGSASVALLAAGGASRQWIELAAGQCVTYGAGLLGRARAVSADAETAWRRGRLVFQDRPLGDVVADINRYRAGRIVIADRALAMLRLDGVFDATKPDAALEAILSTLSLRAFRVTDYLVVLRRAA